MLEKFRIFATCDIGEEALQRLRAKGWDLEVYDKMDAPPRELLLQKVKSGIARPHHHAARPASTTRCWRRARPRG